MSEIRRGRDFEDAPLEPGPGSADQVALRDRRAMGCQFDTGLCVCPSEPFRYEGCRATVGRSVVDADPSTYWPTS